MNTPASAVVPSREAVEEMATLCEMCNDDAVAVMLRTLRAEVERLNTHAERLSRINREVLAESELLSATVADQAAALAERDKDAERYRWLRHGDNDDEVIRYTSRHTANAYVLREEKLDIAIDAALAASVSSEE